jgi:hypothetical protein
VTWQTIDLMQGTNTFEVELVNDNIFEWYVTIEGAKGSFYEVIGCKVDNVQCQPVREAEAPLH